MKGLQVDWYAARSAGVIAYVLLTGGVLLGTTLSARARLPRWPAFAVTDVHRFVAILVGVFVSIHVAAIWLDSFTPFSVAQLLVPGAATYRPLWVALGIVAAELLLAIAVSNALKKRLGHKLWRRVHYLTFAVWAGATAHGLGAGTDASTPWLRFVYVASIAAVLAAVVWRVARSVLPRADVEGSRGRSPPRRSSRSPSSWGSGSSRTRSAARAPRAPRRRAQRPRSPAPSPTPSPARCSSRTARAARSSRSSAPALAAGRSASASTS